MAIENENEVSRNDVAKAVIEKRDVKDNLPLATSENKSTKPNKKLKVNPDRVKPAPAKPSEPLNPKSDSKSNNSAEATTANLAKEQLAAEKLAAAKKTRDLAMRASNENLVAYWPLDDGPVSSTVIAADDIIDNDKHGATDAMASGNGDRWVFDADRDRIVLSTTEKNRLYAGTQDIDLEKGFTWSLWTKVAQSNLADVGADVVIGTRRGGTWHKIGNGGTSGWATISGYQLADDKWHHIAYVGDAANGVSLYIDGELIGTDKSPPTPAYDGPLEIGGSSQFTEDMTGLISDVAIWDKRLSEERIWDLANGGRVLAGPPTVWTPVEVVRAVSKQGATLEKQSDLSVLVKGWNKVAEVYTVEVDTSAIDALAKPITAVRLEALPHEKLPGKGPGRHETGNFVLTNFHVSAAPSQGDDKPVDVELTDAMADFSQETYSVEMAINDDHDDGWAIAPQLGKRHGAVFKFKEPVDLKEGARLTFTLEQNFPNAHNLGCFRLSLTTSITPMDVELRRASFRNRLVNNPSQPVNATPTITPNKTVPSTGPFKNFATSFDLPDTEDLEPQIINELGSEGTVIEMDAKLLVSDQATRRSISFELTREPHDKPKWIASKRNEDVTTPVAQIWATEKAIQFQWLSAAGDDENVNYLRNGVLEFSASGSQPHRMNLRSPVVIEGFRFSNGDYSVKQRLDLDWLPSTKEIQIELLPWKFDKLDTHCIPNLVTTKPAQMFFTKQQAEAFLWLELDGSTRQNKLSLEAELKITVRDRRGKTRPHTFAPELLNNQIAFLQAINESTQAVAAIKDPNQKKQAQAMVAQANKSLAVFKSYPGIVAAINDQSIGVELFYELDGHRVVIAKTETLEK